MSLKEEVINLLFPRRCLGCGQPGKYFCSSCLEQIQPVKFQVCPVCEKPAINGITHSRCQTAASLDGLISIFPYEGMIKSAIGKLKYKFVTDLGEQLFGLIIRTIEPEDGRFKLLKWLSGQKKENLGILIPVPLHPKRLRWRGFNQAELLGKMLADYFHWQVWGDILIRHRHTKPQIKLKGKKRKENIKGAFKISPKVSHFPLPTSNFLIFDDVWTTGSTLKECGSVLKQAGVKKVWGLTLAR